MAFTQVSRLLTVAQLKGVQERLGLKFDVFGEALLLLQQYGNFRFLTLARESSETGQLYKQIVLKTARDYQLTEPEFRGLSEAEKQCLLINTVKAVIREDVD